VDIRRRRVRRKWIDCSCRPERISEVRHCAGLSRSNSREKQSGIGEEWRLTVELQVVLTLQHVVKHSPPAAQAGLPISEDVPGKSKPRCPVPRIGEIDSVWRARITRIYQPCRSIGESLRLQSWNHGERSSLRIFLWRAVFVANTERQRQPLLD